MQYVLHCFTGIILIAFGYNLLMTNLKAFNLYKNLKTLLYKYRYKEKVFLCVGNYKIWYDCFSCELEKMIKVTGIKAYVYGGMNFPILKHNIDQYAKFIKIKHPNACVIVVDNILTNNTQYCGELVIKEESTNIAALTAAYRVGDISVLLYTNTGVDGYAFLDYQKKIVYVLAKIFNGVINNNKNG